MLKDFPCSLIGILWMTAAGISFAWMTVFIRPLAEELHPLQIVFLRNLCGVSIMLPFVARGVDLRIWRSPNLKLHLLRAMAIALAMACWFTAIPEVALSEAIALNFTSPLFVTLMAALFLKEQIRVRRLCALGVGFIGVLIVVRPGFTALHIGQVLILLDAFLWGIAILLIRIHSRSESPQTIVTYMFILVMPLSAVPAAFVWEMPSVSACWLILGIAISSTVGHYCLTKAFSVAETNVLMPFDYLRLIWFSAAGYLAFSEIPDRWTITGAAVIASSTLYLVLRERKLSREGRLRSRPGNHLRN